jgi:small conductance mechanosensitive channel
MGDNTAIIPNSKLSNEVIVNVSREHKRRLDMEIKFNYGVDSQKVREVILHALESVDYVLKDPAPQVGVSLLEIDGYRVMTNAWVEPGSYERSKLQLQEKLISDLKAAGIKLPGMP